MKFIFFFSFAPRDEMVCPMRFVLVAASAAVALFSALAGLLGWTYGSESDEESDDGGEDEKVGVSGATTTSTSPRARRKRKKENRSARQLAATGVSALWDAFTGRYLARKLWRAAAASSSRSASPQRRRRPEEEEKGLRKRSLRSGSGKNAG